VRLPDRLQIGLDRAQFGDARLQIVRGLQAVLVQLGLLGLGLGALQKPLLVLPELGLGLQPLVLGGHLGLFFQLVQVAVQLAQDVLDAGQVLARVCQAVFRLAPALLVLGHAGGLFEEQAQFFRARFDDAADRALANDGVGPRPEAGAQEHILHIAAAHGLIVQVIAAGAVPREHAAHGHLAVLAPLAAGPVVGVVEHQFDAGAAGLLARGGAVEDHVLHRLAAQFAGLALAQHPAHRVHDVGLAAAVGPDHAHQLPGQHEGGRFGKRLESGQLDRGKTHGSADRGGAGQAQRPGRGAGGGWTAKGG